MDAINAGEHFCQPEQLRAYLVHLRTCRRLTDDKHHLALPLDVLEGDNVDAGDAKWPDHLKRKIHELRQKTVAANEHSGFDQLPGSRAHREGLFAGHRNLERRKEDSSS